MKLNMSITTLKQALEEGIAPWADDQILDDSDPSVTIYYDKFPVTRGHFLFVPKTNTPQDIANCLAFAYEVGNHNTRDFNVGMNVGAFAGQTVMYPHIHLIFRYDGDVEDPRGGVRNVIPSKGNYLKSKESDNVDK